MRLNLLWDMGAKKSINTNQTEFPNLKEIKGMVRKSLDSVEDTNLVGV